MATAMFVAGTLSGSTALAANGPGGHSGGGGPGGVGRGQSHAPTTVASTGRAFATAPARRAGIHACPVLPNGCPPGQGTAGNRCYCPARDGYCFGHRAFFNEFWFGQYSYYPDRDTYAAAQQPQVGPDSYYEQVGQQWGKDVKDSTVPKERLVALIAVQMLNIPQHSQKAFRRGFLAAYGAGGETVLAQIIQQAKESNAPKARKNPSVEGQKPNTVK